MKHDLDKLSREHDHEEYVSRLKDRMLWYYVDLDNCIAESVWEHSTGIGKPIWRNIAKLKEVHDAGYKIIIHTSRPEMDYEGIERWCKKYLTNVMGIKIKGIRCGKPLGQRYVDDRAINSEDESWLG